MASRAEIPWWRRDVTFPGFWRLWPLMVLLTLAATPAYAIVASPRAALVEPIAVAVTFVVLWGPRGVMRRDEPPVRR